MSVVYTVGYEKTEIDIFVETLKVVGIKRLADIRALPLSRKKGFSKKALRSRLETECIEYVHLVNLGDPKPGRDAAKAGDYDLFRTIYERHLQSKEALKEFETLAGYIASSPTCLLCFERDPSACHRSIVTDKLVSGLGINVLHLLADDPDRYVRNASRLPIFEKLDSSAFAV